MRPRLREHSQLVVAVSLAFALVFVSATAIGASWSRDQQQPRVTLLGAGDAVSVYVTSGAARLLIVAGDDPPTLGNALNSARRPGLTRLDVLLASGHFSDFSAVSRIVRSSDPRYVGIIGDSERFLTNGIRVTETITRPRQLLLSGDMTVSIDIDKPESDHWRVLIAKGDTVVVILSSPEALPAFPQPPAAALSVFVRGAPNDDTLLYSSAVAVSDDAASPTDFRDLLPRILGPDGYGLRIHDEEAVRFDFVDGGLRLPEYGVIHSGGSSSA